MLDVIRINCQSIHSLNHLLDPRKVDSFDFGWKLAMELVLPQMQARRGKSGLQKNITEKIDMFTRLHPMEVAAAAPMVEGAEVDDGGDEVMEDADQAVPLAAPQANPPAPVQALDLVGAKTGAKRKCRESRK